MTNFNNELLEKAKQAASAEEILALAKKNGVEMTEEQANACYAKINHTSGELSDDELDNVVGGGCTAKGLATSHEDLVKVGTKVRLHWSKSENLSNGTSSCYKCNIGNNIFILVEKGDVYWKFQCTNCGNISSFNATGIKNNCSFEFV